jgi:hypothetical protein
MSKRRKTGGKSAARKTDKRAAPRTTRGAWSIVTNRRRSAKERVVALSELPAAIGEGGREPEAILKIVRDGAEPLAVRLAALETLQAATFSASTFSSWRGDYLATLRKVANDPDPELRQRVLGILAREKDGFAQRKLLEGLEDADKALVSPEKALQLLSYDVHAEAYPLATEIVKNPPNPSAKREALRLLSADATAAPLFEEVLRDKEESPEMRQISAAALQALQPEKLQAYAREALLDPAEDRDMQATSLVALTQFGDVEAIAHDARLKQRITELSSEAPTDVRQTAQRFLDKYGE